MQALTYLRGEWIPAAGGSWADSIDPATGEVVGRFADAQAADAQAAIGAAREAFDAGRWSESPRLRQLVLQRWADRVEARTAELAQLLTRENGKVAAQSRHEIANTVLAIRYYAGLARTQAGHALMPEPGVFSFVVKEPAGVAAIVVPWNAPCILLVRSLAPALAAGCTAVVKMAPQTALTGAELVRCLAEVPDLPAGVVNLFSETGHGAARELVASTDVDVLSFTGSSATGKRIAADAAPTMKKLSLELGGKACCLVFDDCDIGAVARQLAQAATIISGQQCTAARRVLVQASRLQEMRDALRDALAALVVGPGNAAGSQVGPLIDHGTRDRMLAQYERAFDACDEVVLRGGTGDARLAAGAYLSPALVAHRDSGAFFCQEEIFAPLVVLEPFEDERDAVRRANHTVYGLSASVWSRDGARCLRVARALRDGTVWINDHNKLIAEAEHGGYRQSGVGRLLGADALADFTELKHIYQNAGSLAPGLAA